MVVHPAAVLSKQHTSNQPFILYNISKSSTSLFRQFCDRHVLIELVMRFCHSADQCPCNQAFQLLTVISIALISFTHALSIVIARINEWSHDNASRLLILPTGVS